MHSARYLWAFAPILALACEATTSAPSEPSGTRNDAGGADGSVREADGALSDSDAGSVQGDSGGARDSGTNNAHDGGSQTADAGSDASVATNFGKTLGVDTCVPGGPGAPAWVTYGRCPARTRQSPIVSTQTGTIAFTKDLHDPSATLRGIGETTFGTDGTIYANGEWLMALDPQTHAEKWRYGYGGLATIVPGATDSVYISASWDILAITPAFGSLWNTSLTHYVRGGVTPLPSGEIFYLDGGTTLYAHHGQTGAVSWTADVGSPGVLYPAPPAVSSNGTIYLARDTKIVALSATTHQVLWSIPTKAHAVTLDERSGRLYFIYTNEAYSKLAYVSSADGSGLTYVPGTFYDSHTSALALGENGWVYFTANLELHGVQVGTANNWTLPLSGYAGDTVPVVGGDGTVYVTEATSTTASVWAITANGSIRWKKAIATYPKATQSEYAILSIAPTGHLMVTTSGDAMLYALGP